MTKFKKMIALLLSLVMFIGMLPMDALAEIIAVDTSASQQLGRSVVTPTTAAATYIFMNGNAEFARQIVKDGETLNNPGTPQADSANKEFVGWYVNDTKLTLPLENVSVTATSTVTVNAKFEDVYFVFFTNPKGDVMVTKKGVKGDVITTADVTYPVGNEESITGWKNESGEPVSSVTLNNADVTLTAIVTEGHWITYDSQGGSYVEPAFVKGGEKSVAPTAPTRLGYTFSHWSTTEGGSAFTFGSELIDSLTLYAVWTANTNTQYTVIHWQENADDDEYSYKESETKTGTTGATTAATAKSYTGFTAQDITQSTIAGDGSTIVNVYYRRNTYTITFHLDNPTYSCGKEEHTHARWNDCYNFQGNLTCTKEEHTHSAACGKITELTITAKYGANISKQWPTVNGSNTWRTSKENTYQANIDTMPLGGADFYGPHTSDSGTQEADYYLEVLPGETGTVEDGVTYKLDHTDSCPGWGYGVTDEDKYAITGFTFKKVTGNKKGENGLYYNGAKFYYTRNTYQIVYVSNGQTVHTVDKKFEESIADAGDYTPDKPSSIPDAYTFGGWYKDPAGEEAYTFTGKTMPAQNITVYAKWVAPTFTGTAHKTTIGGDDPIEITDIPYGGTIADQLSELQEEIMEGKDGYAWHGWRTGPNGTGEPFNVDTKIYSNITLYPYYTKDGTYSVTYEIGKADVTAPVDSKAYAEDSYADLMSPGALKSSDGQYFLGWSDGTTLYQPRDKYQIKDNVTFTAVWGDRPADVTLTYKANGGTGDDVTQTCANNETVTTIQNPFTREGYTFVGWDTSDTGTGSIAVGKAVQVDSNGENILYAIWTANKNTKYTVQFYYQNTGDSYTLDHSDERTGTTDTPVSVTEADKADKENGKYVFDENNENNVISGTIAGDGTLVLKLYFKLNTASYTIHHYLLGTNVKVADDQTGTKTIGETLTANASNSLYTDYGKAALDSYSPSQTITIDADATKNVITVYYKVPLTLTAGSASKTYDGTPLTQPKFTVAGLVNGDTEGSISLSMTAASTITNAGSVENVIDPDTVKGIPSYYKVTYVDGTLTVNPVTAKVTVTVTENSATYTYDGTEHSVKGYESMTANNTLYDVSKSVTETPTDAWTAKGTNAGEYPVGIVAGNFTNTNANFTNVEFVIVDGVLTINKAPIGENGENITLNPKNAEKVYDGTALESGKATATDKHGNTVKIEYSVDGKTWREDASTITATNVSDSTTIQVRASGTNYEGYVTGTQTLTITERAVTLTSATASKAYDGTALTNDTVTVTGDGFVTGEGATYDVTGSQLDVGSSANSFTYTLNSNTKAGNYDIIKAEGTLTVNPITEKTIVITAESANKTYDGSALTNSGYTYTENVLVEGDKLTAVVEGSQTDVGSSANKVTSYKVMRGDTDVTKNYTFGTSVNGTLTVTKRKVTFTGETAEKTYTGSEQSITGITQVGLVTDHIFESLTYVAKGTNVDTYDGVFSGDVVIKDADGKVVTGNYDVSKTPGKLTIKNASLAVTFTGESATKTYTGSEQSITGITQEGLLTGHTYENLTYVAKGTNVGEYNGVFSGDVVIKDANGVDVTENYVVTKNPGKLTITKASIKVTFTGESATKTYTGSEQSITGITQEGLLTGHTYESLTYVAKGTNVGEYNGVFSGDVVIKDGDVDVTENYVVTKNPGVLTINKAPIGENGENITLNPKNAEKVYDGTALESGKATATDKHGNTVKIEYSVDGKTWREDASTITATNVSDSTTIQVRASGTNYEGYVTGTQTLTITERAVTLTSATASKAYDGTALTKHEMATYAGFVEGEGVDITYSGTQTTVGSSENTYTYAAKSGTDLDNYTVNATNGMLTVTDGDISKYVTLMTVDVEKVYDGAAHATGTATATDTNSNDLTIEYSVDGENWTTDPSDITATNVLESTTVQVRASGDNYAGYVTGTQELKITKRPVTITANNNEVKYDGDAHGKNLETAYTVAAAGENSGLVSGHKESSVNIAFTAVNVGVYTELLVIDKNAVKIMNGEADVTANYDITVNPGTLTITGDELIPEKKAEDEAIESNYKLGEKIEFTITVKNVSKYEVKDIVVTDANAEIQAGTGYTVSTDKHTATIASLAAASEIKITAKHTVTSEDILAGKVGNTANVTWEDTTRETGDETEKLVKPDVTLEVEKASTWTGKSEGKTPELGTEITYTITVTNKGNVPYTNVKFTDTLQSGSETVTGTIPTYGTLAVNETKSFTVTHTVTEADLRTGSIHNEVTATADEITYTYYEGEEAKTDKVTPTDTDDVTDSTTEAAAQLTSVKTTTSTPANKEAYALGEKITYTITVTNSGNQTVTNVKVTENLAGAVITAGTGYTLADGVAVIATLEPGSSVVVNAEYVVKEADILAGKVVNNATVTGEDPNGPDPDPNEPETDDPTDTPKATMTITKAVEGDPANGVSYALGEEITYTLTVSIGTENNVTVEDIKVTDTLLTAENVTNGVVEIAGGYELNANNEIELPDMAPGAADVVITYTYTVQASDLGSGAYGNVHNAATVSGTTPDPKDPDDKPTDPTDSDDDDTRTNIALTITAKDNTVEYDGKAHGENGYTNTSLANGDTISALTMSGGQTNAGVYEDELVPSNARIMSADGKTEVTSQYDITYVPGTLTVNKRSVTLTSATDSKEYDGTPLTNSNVAVGGDGFVEGEGATYNVTGSQLNAGTSNNTFTYTLNSNTKAGNYDIEKVEGKLTVTPRTATISFKGSDVTRVYNGAEQAFTTTKVVKDADKAEGDAYILVTGLVENDTVVAGTIQHTVAGTNVGTYNGEFVYSGAHAPEGETNPTPTIMNGNLDVTDSYTFAEDTVGKLTITPRPVEITANDNTVEYDGMPHGVNETTPYTVTPATADNLESGLVTGHEFRDVEIAFTATAAGKYENKLEITQEFDAEGALTQPSIYDGSGDSATDVTKNYAVTFKPGTLTITTSTKPLVITSESKKWVYDGEAHTYPVYTVTYDGTTITAEANTDGKTFTLPTGDKLTITPDESAKVQFVEDNKPENNTFTYKINAVGEDGNPTTEDRAESYGSIQTTYGTLSIGRRKIAIKAADHEWEYDGKDHEYKFFNVAEWIEVDQSEPIETDWHLVTGTDGKTTRVEYSVEADVTLMTLDTIEHKMSDVQVEGSITYVGTAPNTPKVDKVVIMRGSGEGAKDVTANYEFVKLYNGTLTITGDPLDPEKTIVKEDPNKKYDIGDKIQFTITVQNTTTQTLTNVTVYDETAEIDLPAGDNFAYGDNKHTVIIKSIASGETITLTAWHTVTEADITQKIYKNEVVTTVEYDNKDWPLKADETTTDLEPPVKSLKITKELVDGLDEGKPIEEGRTYKAGETAYFKITVENTGNQTVTGITVNEVSSQLTGEAKFIDDETEWTIDSLAPKASTTRYAYYEVTEADLANNEKCPTNVVTAKTTDDTPDPNPGTEEIPLPEPVTLTIHYLFADGTTAFPDYVATLRPGMPYSVLSPVLEGYLFRTPVEGIMPDEDHVEIVRYIPEGGGGGGGEGGEDEEPDEQPRNVTTLLDYPTPLGLSNVFMNVCDCFE